MKNKGIMRGISAPVVTPFCEDGSINFEEYERLVAFATDNGVHGIFVGGTTGEFVNLTLEERKMLLTAARRGAKPKTPLMFNVTAMNLHDLRILLDWAGECAAQAVSITAPYYHGYDHKALVAYFQTVSEMANGQPLYLYNMVAMTHNPITPAVLSEVARTCPNIRGIKDSSMDFMVLLGYQCAVQDADFEIITGNDAQVLTALQAQAAGGVIAVAGVFPALCVKIWNAFEAGDLQSARQAQKTVLRLREMFREVMPIMSHKKALELQGFHMGPARFPLRDLTAEESEKVERALRVWELL